MKKLLPIAILILQATAFAQSTDVEWPGKYFSGYESTIHGGGFSYHSPQPDVTNSMLIRSLSSTDYIEWSTQEVPSDFSGEYADFVWMFGIDANNGRHNFYLSVNGSGLLTFANPAEGVRKNWSVEGRDGAELTFLSTFIDQYKDVMGYAVLRLPRSLVAAGRQQDIRISGETAGSSSWYMTFETPVEESMDIKQVEAVKRSGDSLLDILEIDVTHLGNSTGADLSLTGGIRKHFSVEPGYNSFQVDYPAVRSTKNISAEFSIGGNRVEKEFSIEPVKDWTIYLVEHTHTDVGYTRPQDEIMPAHLRYIDEALDMCDLTDNYPDAAKFHWTCETAWAVREYLRTRPQQQIDRLLKRIKEGRIEVTGMFLNLSELCDEPTLANMMETIKEFKSDGISVHTAMQDDVNGAAWCLPDYLTSAGVKYFTMGQNTDRALEPFDKPTAFWWESPSGAKIFAYRGEHYMYADFLGILNGDITSFSGNLFRYLKSLESKNFPFNAAMLQFLGYYTDNAPPSIKACDLVRRWNKEYEWPKLKLTTIGEYFDHISQKYSNELPAYKLAWPDWWIDGFGGAENETAHARETQANFIASEGLAAMAELLGAKPKPAVLDKLATINDENLFYDEHTFGAAESISDPLSYNSTVQWNEKRAFAWDAFRVEGLLSNEALRLLRPYVPPSSSPTLTVFNTMSFNRSGVTDAFIFNGMLPVGKAFRIIDDAGNEMPAQLLSRRAEGNYWAIYVKDVPAFGYRTFSIETRDSVSPEYATKNFEGKLENRFYTVEVDTSKGAIVSIVDRETDRQLVDRKAPWELGEFIYETLPNRDGIPRHDVENVNRISMSDVTISKLTDGPVGQSVDINGQIPGCADNGGITCEIRLYKAEKRIELVYSMKKKEVFTPEGAYVAFPFSMTSGEISFEVQGGTVVPGRDQLPGSASDWDGVQNFATVRSADGQIVLSSPDIPIMEFGDINLGKFQTISKYDRPYIYSWVLNNYWTTNFPASQEGGMQWRYELTSVQDTSIGFATDFGWTSRVPLVATTYEGTAGGKGPISKSLLDFRANDPMLIYARPSWNNDGIILCLREIDGRSAALDTGELLRSFKGKRAVEVNSLQENIGSVGNRIDFRPYEVKFIRVK